MGFTNDDEVAKTSRMLRVHGSQRNYYNELLGYNSRLDSMQACILRVKLKYIDRWNQTRRRIAQRYNELLAKTPDLMAPNVTEGHVFHQYTIRIVNGKRNELKEFLASQGIGSMIYYPVPQDQLPVYGDRYKPSPICMQLADEVLSLPIYPELPMRDVETVAEAIDKFQNNSK